MSRKFYLIPFTEDLNEILDGSLPDDIKSKTIIGSLYSTLFAQGRLKHELNPVRSLAAPPAVKHVSTQTEDDLETLVSYISPAYKQKARSLLNLLRPTIDWKPGTYEIIVDEQILAGSNIVDLTNYLLSTAKLLKPPAKFDAVLPFLSALNLAATVVNARRLHVESEKGQSSHLSETEQSIRQSERLQTKKELGTKWQPF